MQVQLNGQKFDQLDLLTEIADALYCPTWDNHSRDGHLEAIKCLQEDTKMAPELFEYLARASALFDEHRKTDTLSLVMRDGGQSASLADAIIAQVPEHTRYIYHGTTSGNLVGI